MDDRATDVFGPPREPTEEDPLAGTPYRFLRRLGAGGMGEVVEAEHETLGHRVALKLLHIEYLTSSEIRERMRLEAQACARIRHDNLVPVHDFGETSDGRVFLAMELLRGRSLADELDARGFLPVEEAVEITRQALSGLAAAHAAGIVHRDIKPENLFLCDFADGSRRVKVLDFGIAKIAHHAGPLTPEPLLKPTAEGMTVGTARWSSPEQSRGEADIDDRSDVYSAGWVLHTMLTGRPPFPHLRTNGDLFAAHSTRVPDAPSVMAPQRIPVTLDAIVLKAIAKRKEDRFPGAEAFRVELGRIGGEAGRRTLAATIEQAPMIAPATPAATIDVSAAEIARPVLPWAPSIPPAPRRPARVPAWFVVVLVLGVGGTVVATALHLWLS
jgi:serine/threonine protein kinase